MQDKISRAWPDEREARYVLKQVSSSVSDLMAEYHELAHVAKLAATLPDDENNDAEDSNDDAVVDDDAAKRQRRE